MAIVLGPNQYGKAEVRDNGLDGPGAVLYHADDRPYGLIEGSVLRSDVPPPRLPGRALPGSADRRRG